ncbi:hypothetical protein TNCT_111241 [Trichonephila clavata]|uniref:Uncharacterized protein n=1 Tax=Trichonephila clavata TaxID=2740835 RepID=A0A8X6K3V0_TRICU|nr:hypothetical protein TNCT_111241 [Trichonephila clavata]
MEVDPPDRLGPCTRILDLMTTIETEDILISNFSGFRNIPDTDQNIPMKEIIRNQIEGHQQGKNAALTELDSLPPCINSNCYLCCTTRMPSNTPSQMPEESETKIENPPTIDKDCESTEDNPLPKRKTKKKCKKPKDVTDDFVFPKKTARPASPIPIEPIATANSFSDLEVRIEVEEQQQMEELPQESPAPKPISPIFLKI